MSKVAVIPARGGSTRLKNKNIYPLNGKPLLEYTIEAVLNADVFDKVYVSTDCNEIKKVAKKYEQVIIYDREATLSDEKTPVLFALLDMMEKIDKGDIFAYFLPTYPFITSDHIKGAFNLFDKDTDFVNSIVEYQFPPQLAMIKHGDSMIPVGDNLTFGMMNSKVIKKYYHNGAFYMGKWDSILNYRNFFSGNIKGYYIDKLEHHDINTLEDMKYAEFIIKEQLIKDKK